MKSVDDHYNDRNLTYHRKWEVTDDQFPNGAVHWILFIIDDDWQPPYFYGVEDTVAEADEQIKWAIGSYLKKNNLL